MPGNEPNFLHAKQMFFHWTSFHFLTILFEDAKRCGKEIQGGSFHVAHDFWSYSVAEKGAALTEEFQSLTVPYRVHGISASHYFYQGFVDLFWKSFVKEDTSEIAFRKGL